MTNKHVFPLAMASKVTSPMSDETVVHGTFISTVTDLPALAMANSLLADPASLLENMIIGLVSAEPSLIEAWRFWAETKQSSIEVSVMLASLVAAQAERSEISTSQVKVPATVPEKSRPATKLTPWAFLPAAK